MDLKFGNYFTCFRCGKSHHLSNFINENNGKQTVTCKSCRSYDKKKLSKVMQKYKILKLSLPPCEICGDDDPKHKEFDHVNPEEKNCSVRDSGTLEQLEKEYKKCRCLCMKCHRKHSYYQSLKQSTENIHGSWYKNKLIRKKYVNHLKLTIGKCQGENCPDQFDPENLMFYDFDHINPEEKVDSISSLVCRRRIKFENLKKELEKCRLLCGYCHQKHTFIQRQFNIKKNKTLQQPINIIDQSAWHIQNPVKYPNSERLKKIFTAERVPLIRQDWNTGKYTQINLSLKYSIPRSNIVNIVNNKTYHDPNYIKSHIPNRSHKRKYL